MTHWVHDLAVHGSAGERGPDLRVGAIAQQPEYETSGVACILISVVRTQGSCPRDAGTRMIVSRDNCLGTIGGGHLEYQAIKIGYDMLAADVPSMRIERFPLGARLGQCCGGVAHISFEFIPARQPQWVSALCTLHRRGEAAVLISQLPKQVPAQIANEQEINKLVLSAKGESVGNLENLAIEKVGIDCAVSLLQNAVCATNHLQDTLFLEFLPANDFHIAVFGAGHVGKALINILATLPCRVTWIDSRSVEFPTSVPENVQLVCCEHPEDEVDELPEDSQIVIMTHSHAVDQAICERALRRGGFSFCGLIGSITKRLQFEKKLLSRGLSRRQWNALSCPIGVNGVNGKHPAEIAIAVSAQILQTQESRVKRCSALGSSYSVAVKL